MNSSNDEWVLIIPVIALLKFLVCDNIKNISFSFPKINIGAILIIGISLFFITVVIMILYSIIIVKAEKIKEKKRSLDKELEDLIIKREDLEKELDSTKSQKYGIQEEIINLEKELYLKELMLKDKKKYLYKKLQAHKKLIFDCGELTEEEINALENHDFEKTMQFDPLTKKNKLFLVKKIMNHSATHTFLVGRIKQMLEKYPEIEDVDTHDTRNADVTFIFKNKTYAVEVETGTLLSKKDQSRKKVGFLNKRFGDRWFFVVTHRKLLSKYKKLGLSTQRSEVSKFLEKLLKT